MTGIIPVSEDDAGELDTGALEALLTRFGGAGPGRRAPAVFPELTTEAYQQAVEQDRAARPYDLLLQLGLGMMASRSPSLFGAIGEAGKTALANVEKTGNQNVRELVQKAQIGGQIAAGDQQRATRQALRTALDSDPSLMNDPAKRALILADPDGVGRAWLTASMQGAKPTFRTITRGDKQIDVMVDGSGNVIQTLGEGPRFAPREPTETFTTLTPEQAAAAGFPRDAVVQRSDRTGKMEVRSGQPPAPPELVRLIQARDALPEGHPNQVTLDQAIQRMARGAGGDETARDRRIADIMSTHNVDRATALNVVDGIERVNVDPVNGETRIVNLVTGAERRPTKAPDPSPRSPEPPPQMRTLYGMADRVTGAIPAGQTALQGVLGQVGVDVAPQGLVEDRQMFANATGELIRALSINPRYPVAEMERIRQEVNISPGVMTDPRTLRERMQAVDASLRVRLRNEQSTAENPDLPVQTRRDASAAANSITNFLQILGVPQQGAGGRRDLPPGLPQGSRPIGRTANGRMVYETPDGRRVVPTE